MFTRYEFERAMHECLHHGDIERIASGTGAKAKTVERYWNENDVEKTSYEYRAAAELSALMARNEISGRRALETFNHYVRMNAKQDREGRIGRESRP